MMRFVAFAFAVMLAGCSGEGGKEQSLAQCRLDANGSAGVRFMRDYAALGLTPEEKETESYNAFIVLCMESKGYKFSPRYDQHGTLSALCWSKNGSGEHVVSNSRELSC